MASAWTKNRTRQEAIMLSDEDFKLLLDHLNRPWAGFRKIRKGVKKRVRRHMTEIGCAAVNDYLQLLDQDPEALTECEHRLLVTISRFYRDRLLWDHLQASLLPALARRFPDGMHVWSAGCGRGEEPYSLSMVWEETAAALFPAPELRIVATDADPVNLEQAMEGIYPPSSLKEIPEHARQRWFHKARGRGQLKIDAHLRTRIDWHVHQLLAPPPRDSFHLILLRNNLLTYYQGAQLKNALAQIIACLPAGGRLILGSHERLPTQFSQMARDPQCPWVYQLKS